MGDGARIVASPTPIIVTCQPVLAFGGCYSNLQATQATQAPLAEAQRLGVPPDRMICTDDVGRLRRQPARYRGADPYSGDRHGDG